MFRIFHVGGIQSGARTVGADSDLDGGMQSTNPQPHNISFDLKFQMICLSISSAKCWYYSCFPRNDCLPVSNTSFSILV